MSDVPPGLLRRCCEVEKRLGKPIILRAVRDPDPHFPGRVTDKGSHVLIEYRDDVVGFFWDVGRMRGLLDEAERIVGAVHEPPQ
jgi:hypothetical protein